MEYNNEELNGGNNYSGPIYVERRGSGCLGNGLKIGCGFLAAFLLRLWVWHIFQSVIHFIKA